MVNKEKNKKNISKVNEEPKSVSNKTSRAKEKIKKRQADDKSARINKARAIKKLFSWTILMGIIVGIIVFLCQSEMFEICNIEITGNSQVSQEMILELSEINMKENIFLANVIKAKSKIIKNPYVKDVIVKRELPDKIKIEVVENQKVYMLKLDNQFAYLDKYGYVLEISENKIKDLIVLEGYTTAKEYIEAGKNLNEEDTERLEDIEQILKSSEKIDIKNKITNISIEDKKDYILQLSKEKKIIYIGDTTNLANKMLYMQAILDESASKEGKIFLNGNLSKGFNPYFREEKNNY